MGLKLTARCLPKHFKRLKKFGVDYRQFDEITFVNTETGQEKTFGIDGIWRPHSEEQAFVRNRTPEIPWDEKRQIYAISLAEEKEKERSKEMPSKTDLREAGMPGHHRREAFISFALAMALLAVIAGRAVWSIL